MNKYGQIAINATNLCNNNVITPVDAWKIEAEKLCGVGSESARKSCPKSAFLGLCEDGLIKGVDVGNYTTSEYNKTYALKAVELLKEHPELTVNKTGLWKLIVGDDKKHNSQMDVVVALFESDLIK